MNATTTACHEMTPELDLACSCQDCMQSCPQNMHYPDVTGAQIFEAFLFGVYCTSQFLELILYIEWV